MSKLTRLAPLFFVACSAAVSYAQAPRPMTLIDVVNVPQVSDPQLSPDGRTILYVEAESNWKSDKRVRHIWKINADGSGLLQMTNGADGETSPRWSPDGQTIAFIAKREGEEANQIFLISPGGGEARALTNHPAAVSDIVWTPDGKSVFFKAPDAKSDAQKAKEKAKDDVFMFDENYQQQHVWRVTVADKSEHRVTQGDYSILSFQLSDDGSKIAFHRAPTPLLEDTDQSEVWVMDSTGGGSRQITHNRVAENDATLSPDNSRVLFISQANAKFDTYYNAKIFVAPASGGDSKLITGDLPYEVERAAWSKDGKSIFFLANMGVHSELFKASLDGGKPEQLTNGQHAIAGWTFARQADKQIYTATDPATPGEVWLAGESGSSPRKITSVYGYLARDFKLPRQERIEWKGADGATVEGLLYYPLDYTQGQHYPLVVQTHGGPQASDKFGFGGSQNYVAVLAAKGYAVLQPNYRGSTGYGDDFLRDMVGHYFQNAHLDVLAGVDYLVSKGIADPDHLVKMGWSGGGHMTNKIITFTNRFKAASAGAGAADWVSMYAQSDIRTFRTPWFGGTPWQKNAPIDIYWNNSPLKDVSNVKTPTIFLVGQNDQRVPEPQSIEMYRALKSNGVPTHLYVAPREPHGWEELRHVLFKMNAELDWFEKYAMSRQYTWEQAPATPAAP
ncbi:MAG TPA: S9 family peptidase [Bryobacteraceae bacterium]|nr:S9 family peptidase [Bryobacteraceae bacterium]